MIIMSYRFAWWLEVAAFPMLPHVVAFSWHLRQAGPSRTTSPICVRVGAAGCHQQCLGLHFHEFSHPS
jgi:hypothetical protein